MVANDQEGGQRRPELDYPCLWRYRLIGSDVSKLREAIASVVGGDAHEVQTGNTSSAGRYVSVELAITVRDEEHRLRLFEALAAHEHVKVVL